MSPSRASGAESFFSVTEPEARSSIRLKAPLLAAAVLSFVSGAAGLAHQVLWTRRLVDVLGATSLTFSKVIGAFFLGLALGGWLAARFQPHRNAWIAVAIAEAFTALAALPVLWIPQWVSSAPSLPIDSNLFKTLLPILLVTPPALLMGLVLPWLVRVFEHHAARNATVVYGINILGGITGIVLLLLFTLPRFGTLRSGFVAIGLNLLVAAAALIIACRAQSPIQDSEPLSDRRSAALGIIILSFASGFLVLASEVVLQHQFAQVTINSFFSNGSVLALVLLGLGASALLLPLYIRLVAPMHQLPLAFALSALCLAVQPSVLLYLRPGLEILPYELKPIPYTVEVLRVGLLAIFPLFLTAGLVFPLILRKFFADYGQARFGQLLAWNGVGGWLGAELAQYFLAPNFGLWLAMLLIAGCYSLAALISATATIPRVLAIVPLCAAAALVPLYRTLPQVSTPPTERLVDLKVSPDGVVATVESAPGDWRILFNNSYTLGGSTAQFNQERQSHIPLLIHGAPKTVALLGIATGSTTAGAAVHPGIESIDAFELSPVVLDYARKHFSPYNRNVFLDPRVRAFAEDARWGIAARREAYDVIIGDLFLPWRTGEGRLFAIEHFRNVRRALKSDGVFCQWLPMFQLTRQQFESIARTFKSVFPEAFLVRGDFYAEQPIIGLVGGRSFDQIEWPQTEAFASSLRGTGKVRDPLALHADGLAMMLIGPIPDFPAASLNSLDNGWLEWNAGRNILGMPQPWFIGVPLGEFIRDIQRAAAPQVPEAFRAAHDAGQFFLTLEIAQRVDAALAGNLRAQIPARLPESLRADPTADWKQWPSRVKPELP